jgi:ABC-type multidrug transport system fused ATPase/permease subunit
MSPEQATGAAADGRSDIYSLGCLMYELMTGQLPFPASSPAHAISRRLTENPPSTRDLRDTVPPLLDQVILRSLARNPADRFSTAEELRRALTPSESGAHLWSGQPPRARRRTRMTIGAIGVLLVTAASFLLWRGGADSTSPADRLVVFPFTVVGDSALEYLGEGMVEFASYLTIAVVLWQSAGAVAAGTIYLFIDWMRRFFMPLRDLSAKYSVMQSSMASAERIFQLLDTEPRVLDATTAAPPPARAGKRGLVEFENVWFSYADDDDWVLRDVSFRVEPGQSAAFVGATGAGKTTIIKLLTRLYDVSRGSIRIDGVDLREWPQQALRRRVAMVLQDVFLFSGSIEQNLSRGREDVGAERVREATRAVLADRFIARLRDGQRALAVTLNAQFQCFKALQQHPSIKGRKTRSGVTQERR